MTTQNENTPDTNPSGADNPTFSECKFLLRSYGSEENFRAVAGSEIGALDTSKLIVDFLKAKAEGSFGERSRNSFRVEAFIKSHA